MKLVFSNGTQGVIIILNRRTLQASIITEPENPELAQYLMSTDPNKPVENIANFAKLRQRIREEMNSLDFKEVIELGS